jgi:hypothetical protein
VNGGFRIDEIDYIPREFIILLMPANIQTKLILRYKKMQCAKSTGIKFAAAVNSLYGYNK